MASAMHHLATRTELETSEARRFSGFDGSFHESLVGTDIRRAELALSRYVQHAELHAKHEEPTHRKAPFRDNKSSEFVALLRECAKNGDLQRGSQLHDDIQRSGLTHRCSDALVSMYAKCGAIKQAKELLEIYKSKNVSSWTALIAVYTQHGKGREAIDCFKQMQREGISPDTVSFACVLRACASIKAVDKGSVIHQEIASQGLLGNDTMLGNALVDMYAKCGEFARAQQAFEELPTRNVVSWNSLIAGYAQHEEGVQALRCFEGMKREGVFPDEVTYTCILKACSTIKANEMGERVHDEVARKGFLKGSPVLGAALVHMYANWGALKKAQQVLEEIPFSDVVVWNSLIGGYAKQGRGAEALQCFKSMQQKGISPNAVTFTCILKACGTLRDAAIGQKIHEDIAREGLLKNNVVLGTALVDMYATCGALARAAQVLGELPSRNVVSWSALIAGYAQHGQGEQALSCFEQMQHEGITPDRVIYIWILKACGSIKVVEKGDDIFDEIARQGLLKSDVMLGTAVVDMYVKCCAFAKARQVLETLASRNAVAWNTLIAGYTQEGQCEEALIAFQQMQCEGICPDSATFTCILKVCSILRALDKGKLIHDEIVRQKLLGNDAALGTALVDMYVKCGNLIKAREALQMLPCRNVISWNTLIAGYVQQGHVEEALNSFKLMQLEGISPDAVTYASVLSSCSHLGLVEDGYAHFVSMSMKYGLKPQLEHFISMVDLFGRAGHLDKATQLIQGMPFTDDSVIFSALLGACQKWGDVKVGRWAFQQAVLLDRGEGGAYVLMANLHAVAAMQADAQRTEA